MILSDISIKRPVLASVLSLLILLVGMWPALTSWLTSPAGSALLAAFGN